MTLRTVDSWQSVSVKQTFAGEVSEVSNNTASKTSQENDDSIAGKASRCADEVVIRVPASPHYERLVQAGAVSIARRQKMPSAAVEDLRTAIVQASEALVERATGSGAVIEFVFRTHKDFLEMQAQRIDKPELRFERRFHKSPPR